MASNGDTGNAIFRPMTRREKIQLQKLIQNLPWDNLVRVVGILVGEWVGSMAIPLCTVLQPPIAESGIDFLMRNYELLLGQYFQSFEFDSKGLL